MRERWTKKEVDGFKLAANHLIKWINENGHPHLTVIVDCRSAELVSGEIYTINESHIKD